MEAVAESTSVSTPSAAPSTPSAAPATSAPSSSPTPSQRPTFAQAFARDAAQPADPSSAQPEAATTAPAGDGLTEGAQGPIPFTVHKTALENARTKEADRVRAEVQAQYGWAAGVDRSTAEAGMQIGRMFQQDRPGFIRQVLAEAMADQTLAPMVRSEAARVLGSRRQEAPADLSPDIPVMDAQGNMVAQTYSATRVQQIVQQALEQALQPLQQDYQQRQQRDQQVAYAQQLESTTQDIWSDVSSLPGFADHKDEIAKVFAATPGDPGRALRAAWKQVVGPKVGVVDKVRADYQKELQTKAAASTVNPASAVIPATKRPRSFKDPSLKWD